MIKLFDRSIISIEGKDKESFLQGIITNNINKLNKLPVYAVILSPQGRFLFEIFLYRYNDIILIDCESKYLLDLILTLNKYKLRSAVNIEEFSDEYNVLFSLEDQKQYKYIAGGLDPRILNGYRFISNSIDFLNDFTLYEKWRVENTLPKTDNELIIGKTFAIEAGLDLINAIDFNKGCFIGQEVTTRSRHKLAGLRSLYHVKSNNKILAETIVTTLSGAEIGKITSAFDNESIALCNVDAVSSNDKFKINEEPISIANPVWKNK